MGDRLQTTAPKKVDAHTVLDWSVFTDAAYEPDDKQGGLGGVLVGPNGDCAGWFSLVLDAQTCAIFGSTEKETIIYELELLGACVALDVWADVLASAYPVHYGDNDSVRFALIRGTALGPIAESIMNLHLHIEVQYNSNMVCSGAYRGKHCRHPLQI